ncbi:MAG: hypothetical protein NTV12_10885 [Verrucomicrobia bacterium]|nr:hypothetical protein [Verrucomicrobiota bacterium]
MNPWNVYNRRFSCRCFRLDVATQALALVSLAFLSIAPLVCAQPEPVGKTPNTQKESDWVDARWNQTDLGAFHASVLPI